MGPLGVPEMFAIFVIALLLFGPKKLPELGRTLGKALSEFRRAKNELKTTFESHLNELERETRLTTTTSSTPTYDYSSSYPYEDYNQYDSESPNYSEPAQISPAQENHAALPPAADAPLSEQPSTQHENLPASPQVSGTVARTNGVRPLEESIEPKREEHPDLVREEHSV
ncbi:MAG TPA: twin-arginine translocase TatA/TatE family subunit [Bryobacteraceae bacterium]|nr:twin-arginine translocase TatA/TatE family subunit [Bryobacteraceae bacterium]